MLALQKSVNDAGTDGDCLQKEADVCGREQCDAVGIACHGLTSLVEKALQPLLTKQAEFAAWASSGQVESAVTVAKTPAAFQTSALIAMSAPIEGFSKMGVLVELAELHEKSFINFKERD